MTVIQTMRVGSLELRKTATGWEYLSEGVGNEPDLWCDATAALGPVSYTHLTLPTIYSV